MKYCLSFFQNIICIILFGIANSVYGMNQPLLEAETVSYNVDQVIINMGKSSENNTTYKYQPGDEKLVITIPKGYYPEILAKRQPRHCKCLKKIFIYGTCFTAIAIMGLNTFYLKKTDNDSNKYGPDIDNAVHQFTDLSDLVKLAKSVLDTCPHGATYLAEIGKIVLLEFIKMCNCTGP